MDAAHNIVQTQPEILLAISLYKDKSSEITGALYVLMNDLGNQKVDVKYVRNIMDKYVQKTEKLSEEVELIREE